MKTIDFLRANAAFLGAGALLTLLSSFGQTFFIAVFAGHIRAEFGLSHGQWGAIYAAGTFGSAVVMLWAGGLADRFAVRRLALVVLPGLALACLAMALVPGPAALVGVILALRLLGQGMTSHISAVAMARWFVATRGRALAVAGLGFSLGEAVLPVVFVAALGVLPWRLLWVVAAALILIALPGLIRLLRQERAPRGAAQSEHLPGLDGRHWRRADVLRHWLFWSVVPLILGPAAFGTAFFFHQVHFAETRGLPHLTLVALFPLYTAVSVGAMALSGLLLDRIGTARLMPVFQLPMGLGFGLLGLAQGPLGVAAGLGLLALTVGANSTVPAAFWAEFYGTRHLGAIKAMAAAVMVLGSAIGPILTGALIDAGLALPAQMPGIALWFGLAAGVAALGVGRARRGLPPAGEIDIPRA